MATSSSLQKTVVTSAAININPSSIVGKEKTKEILKKAVQGVDALLQPNLQVNLELNPKKSAQVVAKTAAVTKRQP